MKNPLLVAILGLILNIFSLIIFDYKFFLMSLAYMAFIFAIYCFICPVNLHCYLLLSTFIFFSFFNYYLAGIWNFMQMDEVYDKPWANSFLYFKKWFLRYIVLIISIFLAIMFIKSGGGLITVIFKLTGLVFLMPSALLLYEYLENLIINALYGLFNLPVNE